MKNNKYVVFKREDWEDFLHDDFDKIILDANEIHDAVVIRMQDVFASPALFCYAHSIALAAELLRVGGSVEESKRLQAIADYFAEAATEAGDMGTQKKLPD